MGLVVVVAGRIEGADASSVLAPLVLPESLVIALVILPVGVHVCEQVRLAERVQDSSDVGVCARCITVGIVGAVAMIWPQAVDGPRIDRTWRCQRALMKAGGQANSYRCWGQCPRTGSGAAVLREH